MNRALTEHFRGKSNLTNVPSWETDLTWLNDIQRCPLPINMDCEICLKLMFSKNVMGKAIKPMSWFNDYEKDMSSIHVLDLYPEVHEIAYKYLMENEKKLRSIRRFEVLHQLLVRFRGYDTEFLNFTRLNPKQPKARDVLSIIFRNFDSINKWFDFKIKWDYDLYKVYYEKKKDKKFYCTGCGKKCITLMNHRYWGANYQVCPNPDKRSKCTFFASYRSIWAKVREEHELNDVR